MGKNVWLTTTPMQARSFYWYSARAFVPFYAQRLSWASAGGVADGILASLAKASRGRLRDRSSGSP